jgi:hypothetical protein
MAPGTVQLTESEKLLAAAASWAADGRSNALFVNDYDTWLAHGTTDGATWTWPPIDYCIDFKNAVLATLTSAGMSVTCAGDIPQNLSGYDLVFLYSYYACEPRFVPLLRDYVANGGGLIMISGVPEYLRCYSKDLHTLLPTDPLSVDNYLWMGFGEYSNSGGTARTVVAEPFGSTMGLGTILFSVPDYQDSNSAVLGITGTAVALYDSGGAFAVNYTYGAGRVYYQALIMISQAPAASSFAHGFVKTSHGYAVPAAGVVIDESQTFSCADDGSFIIHVAPGNHSIIISAQGFASYSSSIELADGDDLDLGTIELKVDNNSMGLVPFSNGGDYRMLVPWSWIKTFNLTISGTSFLLKLEGPQVGGFTSNILLETGRDDSVSDLSSYESQFVSETIEGLQKAGVQAAIMEQPRITSSGADQVMVFALQYADGAIAQKMALIFNQTTHQYWILICTTSGDSYQESAPMFDQVIESFQAQGTAQYDSSKILLGIAFIVIVAVVCVAAFVIMERKKRVRKL